MTRDILAAQVRWRGKGDAVASSSRAAATERQKNLAAKRLYLFRRWRAPAIRGQTYGYLPVRARRQVPTESSGHVSIQNRHNHV